MATLGFITLRIYKVLKQAVLAMSLSKSFITLRIYKVLKHEKTWRSVE